MSDVAMGRGAEFDLIRQLRERWGTLAVGLGDDAAILELPRGDRMVATMDTAMEGVHFKREWLSLQEIGYRAVTAALSDIAAMAAQPRGVLVAIAAPSRDAVLALGDGVGDAVRVVGTVIIGGNLSNADSICITTTALGSAFTPLRRDAARPGDFVYLTGALGGPTAALRALESGLPVKDALRERFARPRARIAEAQWLALHGAMAGVDVSDGLVADAGHIAAASNCFVALEQDRIPVFPGARLEDAYGGEEYELIAVSRTPLPEQEFAARFGVSLTLIGRCKEGPARAGVNVAGKEGVPVSGSAWVHFEA